MNEYATKKERFKRERENENERETASLRHFRRYSCPAHSQRCGELRVKERERERERESNRETEGE